MSVSIVDRINKTYRSPVNILFDECHGESWSISIDIARQINPRNINNCSYESVAKILREEKFNVDRLSTSPVNASKLSNCDVFVIVHPTDGKVCKNTKGEPFFDDTEIEDIVKWVSNGGSLFVLYEYETNKWGSNINSLLERFEMSFEDNALIDMYHNIDNNPSSVSFNNIASNHKILDGIKQVIYYAGSTIKIDGSATGVLISDQDAEPPYAPVIACNQFNKGRVVAIGDTDLFDPVRITDADHANLVINIFNWLSTDNPSIVIDQDIKLFSDRSIIIDWEIKNTGETLFDNINVTDVITAESLSFSRINSAETRIHRSKYVPQPNSLIPTIGKCKVSYSYDGKPPKYFDIQGAKINQPSRFSDYVFFEYEASPNFPMMPLCPMNYKKCMRNINILKKYRNHRVFLDIPYGKEYAVFEEVIRDVLNEHGLISVAAKDNATGRILLCNICEEIQSCAYAIADLKGFSANILYELGLVHALGKRCAMLKPKDFDRSLSDITGLLYINYETPEDIRKGLDLWIKQEIFMNR